MHLPVDGRRGDRDAGEVGTEHATIAALLRLHHDGVSAREIGPRLGWRCRTIQDNLKRAAAAGLAWPPADGVTDYVLERQLFGCAGVAQGQRRRVSSRTFGHPARGAEAPGRDHEDHSGRRYREADPEGYDYSRFCDLLRGFRTGGFTPGDAPAPCRRGKGVRGRLQASGSASSIRRRAKSARRRFRWRRPRRSNLTYAEGRPDADFAGWTGASRCACSAFSAARRSCWLPVRSEERGQQGLHHRSRDLTWTYPDSPTGQASGWKRAVESRLGGQGSGMRLLSPWAGAMILAVAAAGGRVSPGCRRRCSR